jgi:hypothetical protein
VRVELAADGLIAARIDIGLGESRARAPVPLSATGVPLPPSPLVSDFPEVEASEGVLSALDSEPVAAAFPNLANRVGARTCATMAQLSALVGMVCPGLHSIFGGFRLEITANSASAERLSFRVGSADERVRMLVLAVSGGGVAGEVTAFVRRPPRRDRDLAGVAQRVRAGEFASTTALIVGGSRGLGAVTARAILAGGGRAIITYRVGAADAARMVEECPERCRSIAFDVRGDAASQLAPVEWPITQMYYFATPPIFRQKAGWWDPARFTEFCDFYIQGFARICEALRVRGPGFAVFYPSSVAIDERPRNMTEYTMAKVAGEVLCADMKRFERGIRVVTKRLPRVDTDQTSTLVAAPSAEPLDVMLPIIRELHIPPA